MKNKPDSLEEIIAAMNPEIHLQLKKAVELGRWENGDRLSREQRENCLQAIIAYDNHFISPENRVGYLDRSKKDCDTKAQTTHRKG